MNTQFNNDGTITLTATFENLMDIQGTGRKIWATQGLFQIEVEQIIEEADYDPKASDDEDNEEDYDDDEPF